MKTKIKEQTNQQKYQLDSSEEKAQEHHQKSDVQNSLLTFYQNYHLQNIFKLIQSKKYWLKFTVFKKLTTKLKPSQLKTIKLNKLINVLNHYSLQKYTNYQLLKQAFDTLKILKSTEISKKIKLQIFFIKYLINQTYIHLSQSFNTIKFYSKNQSNKLSQQISTSKPTENSKTNNLIKFQKQSLKFKSKTFFIILRNFLLKKIFKPSFIQLKNTLTSQIVQVERKKLGMTFGTQQTNQQQKDVRFIKKKILPHKVIQGSDNKKVQETQTLNLSRIRIGKYEIQTMKKKHFNIIRTLSMIVSLKKLVYYNIFWTQISKLIEKRGLSEQRDLSGYNQNSSQNNSSQQKIEQKCSQFQILRNVNKHLCYLSSQISLKNKKNKTNSHIKWMLKTITIFSIVKQNQYKLQAFYKIKNILFYQQKFIELRILQLQQIKNKYLEYFNSQSMRQQQDSQENSQIEVDLQQMQDQF